MKKAIVIVALLLLFGALGGDGYHLLQYGLPGGYEPPQTAPPMQTEMPVHAKNSIRPTDDMIWRGEVMDLTRLDDRRPAIGD